MIRPVAALCGTVLLSAGISALQLTLDRRAIEEAIYIGQSRIENERARFHTPYRVMVAQLPVDWIDVITPFHRVELAAEMNARRGGRQFGQREALEVLKEAAGGIDLVVELSFHPLNTFVGMPIYQVGLVNSGGALVAPRRLDRYPRFGPRAESQIPMLPMPNAMPVFGAGQPVLGGTMVAAFDGSMMDEKGRFEVVVLDGKTELARARLDLARMR